MSGRGKGGKGPGKKRPPPEKKVGEPDKFRDLSLSDYVDALFEKFSYGSPNHEVLDSLRDLFNGTIMRTGAGQHIVADDVDLEVALRNATLYYFTYKEETGQEGDEAAVARYEREVESQLELGDAPEGVRDDGGDYD